MLNRFFKTSLILCLTLVPWAQLALAQDENPDFVQNVVELVNAQRLTNGLTPLRASALLTQSAQNHANDQSRRNYIGHNSPEGVTPTQRIMATGYDRNAYTGENIYNGFGSASYTSPQAAVNWWMNSPAHRANILNPSFTELGVGLAITTSTGMHIYVQNFGSAATTGDWGWGAVAYSPSRGYSASSNGRKDAIEATTVARSMCRQVASDCVVSAAYRGACGVIKHAPSNTARYGIGIAGGSGMPAINLAGHEARVRCLSSGGQFPCNELVVASCSQ